MEFTEQARELSTAALGVVARELTSSDPRMRLWAARIIMDRAWGKPHQSLSGPDGGPLQMLSYDLSRLTLAELQSLTQLRQRASVEREDAAQVLTLPVSPASFPSAFEDVSDGDDDE